MSSSSRNEQLGERRWFLKENEEYKALRLDGRLLDLVLPPQIALKVVDTVPPARGGATAEWKEAKLETGLQDHGAAVHRQRRNDPRGHRRKEILGTGICRGIGPTASRQYTSTKTADRARYKQTRHPELNQSASENGSRFYFAPRIASLAALATRNFTTRLALIWIASPVAGLRPMRALRFTNTSLPRPGSVKVFLAFL